MSGHAIYGQLRAPWARKYLRSIALMLCLTFILPFLTWAFELPVGQDLLPGLAIPLRVPEKFGTLCQTGRGDERLIVHIQDLHCHEQVQKNIAGLITTLAQDYGVRLVGQEGAFEPIDLGPFRSFPFVRVRRAVSDYFLRQGKLTGSEWVAANDPQTVAVEGVDSPEMYQASEQAVRAFLTSESQGLCQDLRESLEALKPALYSPELRAWDRLRSAWRYGELPTADYARQVARQAADLALPWDDLLALREFLAAADPAASRVESDRLFRDLDALDSRGRQALYRDPQPQELDRLLHRLDIVEKMLNISVTPEELEEYRQAPEQFRSGRFAAFAQAHGRPVDEAADFALLDSLLARAGDFYVLADRRSAVFVDRLLASMNRHGVKRAALVTGGYHTAGVIAALKHRGVSYAEVAPLVSPTAVVNPYFNLLQNRRTPLEKLLAKNQTILALRTSLADPLFLEQLELLLKPLAEALGLAAANPEAWKRYLEANPKIGFKLQQTADRAALLTTSVPASGKDAVAALVAPSGELTEAMNAKALDSKTCPELVRTVNLYASQSEAQAALVTVVRNRSSFLAALRAWIQDGLFAFTGGRGLRAYLWGVFAAPWAEFRLANLLHPVDYFNRHPDNRRPDGRINAPVFVPRLLIFIVMYGAALLAPLAVAAWAGLAPGPAQARLLRLALAAVLSPAVAALAYIVGAHAPLNALFGWAQASLVATRGSHAGIGTLKRRLLGKNASQVLTVLQAMPDGQIEDLFAYLDEKAKLQGLTKLTILERYLFVAVFQLGRQPLALRLARESRFLSEPGRQRLLQTLELGALDPRRGSPAFSEIGRILYYEAIETDDVPRFNPAEPLAGMPKVLLTGPYKAGEKKLGQFVVPPLGVHRIASFLKAFGYQADVYDVNLYGEAGYFEALRRGGYNIIGFSLLEPTLKDQMRLMLETGRLAPEAFVMAGGQGAAFNASFILENTPAKAVTRGVGEFSLLDMAVRWDRDGLPQTALSGIKAVYYKDDAGASRMTSLLPEGLTQEDLRLVSMLWDPASAAYPDYWQFNEARYSDAHMRVMNTGHQTKTARIYTESHCPLGCDFCSSTQMFSDAIEDGNQKLRLLPARDIVRMIKRLKKVYPDLEAVYFNDDDFFVREQRVREVAEALIKERLNKKLAFFALSRTDHVNPDLLQLVRSAGFYMLIYGVESFAEHILHDMEKKVGRVAGKTPAQVNRDAVEASLAAGIIPRISLLLFYPTTTLDDIHVTVDNVVDLMRKGAIVDEYTFVEPYAGAKIRGKGYEIAYEEETFETLRGKQTLRFPTRILPINPTVRAIALEAVRTKPELLEKVKRHFAWSYGELPKPVDSLVTFLAIYRAAQRYDPSGKFNTSAIEAAIAELLVKAAPQPQSGEEARTQWLTLMELLPLNLSGLIQRSQTDYRTAIKGTSFAELMRENTLLNAQAYFWTLLRQVRDFNVSQLMYNAMFSDPAADYEFLFIAFSETGDSDLLRNPYIRERVLGWLAQAPTERVALLIHYSELFKDFLRQLDSEEYRRVGSTVARALVLDFEQASGLNSGDFSWIYHQRVPPYLDDLLKDLRTAHQEYCRTQRYTPYHPAYRFTAWAGVIEELSARGYIVGRTRNIILGFLAGIGDLENYYLRDDVEHLAKEAEANRRFGGAGGLMPWLRAWFVRLGVAPHVYDRWVAWVVENSLSLAAGLLVSAALIATGAVSPQVFWNVGYLAAWPIFYLLHYAQMLWQGRAPPLRIALPALTIAAVNLALLLMPWSMPVVFLASFVIHGWANQILSRSTVTLRQYLRNIAVRPWTEFTLRNLLHPKHFILRKHNNLNPDGSLDYMKLAPRILGLIAMYGSMLALPAWAVMSLPAFPSRLFMVGLSATALPLALAGLGFAGMHAIYNALVPWAPLSTEDHPEAGLPNHPEIRQAVRDFERDLGAAKTDAEVDHGLAYLEQAVHAAIAEGGLTDVEIGKLEEYLDQKLKPKGYRIVGAFWITGEPGRKLALYRITGQRTRDTAQGPVRADIAASVTRGPCATLGAACGWSSNLSGDAVLVPEAMAASGRSIEALMVNGLGNLVLNGGILILEPEDLARDWRWQAQQLSIRLFTRAFQGLDSEGKTRLLMDHLFAHETGHQMRRREALRLGVKETELSTLTPLEEPLVDLQNLAEGQPEFILGLLIFRAYNGSPETWKAVANVAGKDPQDRPAVLAAISELLAADPAALKQRILEAYRQQELAWRSRAQSFFYESVAEKIRSLPAEGWLGSDAVALVSNAHPVQVLDVSTNDELKAKLAELIQQTPKPGMVVGLVRLIRPLADGSVLFWTLADSLPALDLLAKSPYLETQSRLMNLTRVNVDIKIRPGQNGPKIVLDGLSVKDKGEGVGGSVMAARRQALQRVFPGAEIQTEPIHVATARRFVRDYHGRLDWSQKGMLSRMADQPKAWVMAGLEAPRGLELMSGEDSVAAFREALDRVDKGGLTDAGYLLQRLEEAAKKRPEFFLSEQILANLALQKNPGPARLNALFEKYIAVLPLVGQVPEETFAVGSLASELQRWKALTESRKSAQVPRQTVTYFEPGRVLAPDDSTLSFGAKGSRLAEMCRLNLPVPAGFVIASQQSQAARKAGGLSQALLDEMAANLDLLETSTGQEFGGRRKPLLVSVRSGADVSMPGKMETLTLVGLNDISVQGLADQHGEVYALRKYADYILNYGVTVMGAPEAAFAALRQDVALAQDAVRLRQLVQQAKAAVRKTCGRAFPQDAPQQLTEAVRAVMASWEAPAVRAYRERLGLPDTGTGVTVQKMVLGDAGPASGSGVVYSRDLYTGADNLSGSFGVGLAGQAIVSGQHVPAGVDQLASGIPAAYAALKADATLLEKHFKEIQDIEYTVENGQLYLLQTRDAGEMVYPVARIQSYLDLIAAGALTEDEIMAGRMTLEELYWAADSLTSPRLAETAPEPAGMGQPAAPGIAAGRIAFSAETAAKMEQAGEKYILVKERSGAEDEAVLLQPNCAGAIDHAGSNLAHAPSLLRKERNFKPAVVAVPGMFQADEDDRPFWTLGLQRFAEGDLVTIDGNTGRIYPGQVLTEKSPLLPKAFNPRFVTSWTSQDEKLWGLYQAVQRWTEVYVARHKQEQAAFETVIARFVAGERLPELTRETQIILDRIREQQRQGRQEDPLVLGVAAKLTLLNERLLKTGNSRYLVLAKDAINPVGNETLARVFLLLLAERPEVLRNLFSPGNIYYLHNRLNLVFFWLGMHDPAAAARLLDLLMPDLAQLSEKDFETYILNMHYILPGSVPSQPNLAPTLNHARPETLANLAIEIVHRDHDPNFEQPAGMTPIFRRDVLKQLRAQLGIWAAEAPGPYRAFWAKIHQADANRGGRWSPWLQKAGLSEKTGRAAGGLMPWVKAPVVWAIDRLFLRTGLWQGLSGAFAWLQSRPGWGRVLSGLAPPDTREGQAQWAAWIYDKLIAFYLENRLAVAVAGLAFTLAAGSLTWISADSMAWALFPLLHLIPAFRGGRPRFANREDFSLATVIALAGLVLGVSPLSIAGLGLHLAVNAAAPAIMQWLRPWLQRSAAVVTAELVETGKRALRWIRIAVAEWEYSNLREVLPGTRVALFDNDRFLTLPPSGLTEKALTDVVVGERHMPVEYRLSARNWVLLKKYLEQGGTLILLSNGDLNNLLLRVAYDLPKALRQRILVAHCGGRQVYRFDASGQLASEPAMDLVAESFAAEGVNDTERQAFEAEWIRILDDTIGQLEIFSGRVAGVRMPVIRVDRRGDQIGHRQGRPVAMTFKCGEFNDALNQLRPRKQAHVVGRINALFLKASAEATQRAGQMLAMPTLQKNANGRYDIRPLIKTYIDQRFAEADRVSGKPRFSRLATAQEEGRGSLDVSIGKVDKGLTVAALVQHRILKVADGSEILLGEDSAGNLKNMLKALQATDPALIPHPERVRGVLTPAALTPAIRENFLAYGERVALVAPRGKIPCSGITQFMRASAVPALISWRKLVLELTGLAPVLGTAWMLLTRETPVSVMVAGMAALGAAFIDSFTFMHGPLAVVYNPIRGQYELVPKTQRHVLQQAALAAAMLVPALAAVGVAAWISASALSLLLGTGIGLGLALGVHALWNFWLAKRYPGLAAGALVPGGQTTRLQTASNGAVADLKSDLGKLKDASGLIPATWQAWLAGERRELPLSLAKLSVAYSPASRTSRSSQPLVYDAGKHALVWQQAPESLSESQRLAAVAAAMEQYRQAREQAWGDEWPADFQARMQRLERVREKIRKGEPVTIAYVCLMNQERSFLADVITADLAAQHRKPVTVISGGTDSLNPDEFEGKQREALSNMNPNFDLAKIAKQYIAGPGAEHLAQFHSRHTSPELSDQADIIFVATTDVEEHLVRRYEEDKQAPFAANQSKVVPLAMLTETFFREYGRDVPDFSHWGRRNALNTVSRQGAEKMYQEFADAIRQGLFNEPSREIRFQPNEPINQRRFDSHPWLRRWLIMPLQGALLAMAMLVPAWAPAATAVPRDVNQIGLVQKLKITHGLESRWLARNALPPDSLATVADRIVIKALDRPGLVGAWERFAGIAFGYSHWRIDESGRLELAVSGRLLAYLQAGKASAWQSRLSRLAGWQLERILEHATAASAREWKSASLHTVFFEPGRVEGPERLTSRVQGKGGRLAEMCRMNLPVPPGFTIAPEISLVINREGEIPAPVVREIAGNMARLNQATGLVFGDPDKPLLVSVRSGAEVSMPGLMQTVTNLGLNDRTVQGLARMTGNPLFAYWKYAEFIAEYAATVMGAPEGLLEDVRQNWLEGLEENKLITVDDWQRLIQAYKAAARRATGQAFPQDPGEQLQAAVKAVAGSWDQPAVRDYRQRKGIPDLGTGVTIQKMVFGDLNLDSGSGVVYSRDLYNGERTLSGNYESMQAGHSIVSGRITPHGVLNLREQFPEAYQALAGYAAALENRFKEIQDLEYTIENGRLYLLQDRDAGKMIFPVARVRSYLDMIREGQLTEEAIVNDRMDLEELYWAEDYFMAPRIASQASQQALGWGQPAAPGIGTGKAVFSIDQAEAMIAAGEFFILVQARSSSQDEGVLGDAHCSGSLDVNGSPLAHAPSLLRKERNFKPAVVAPVGPVALEKANGVVSLRLGNRVIRQGETITLDGNTGAIYAGEPKVEHSPLLKRELMLENAPALSASDARLWELFLAVHRWKTAYEQKYRQEEQAFDSLAEQYLAGAALTGITPDTRAALEEVRRTSQNMPGTLDHHTLFQAIKLALLLERSSRETHGHSLSLAKDLVRQEPAERLAQVLTLLLEARPKALTTLFDAENIFNIHGNLEDAYKYLDPQPELAARLLNLLMPNLAAMSNWNLSRFEANMHYVLTDCLDGLQGRKSVLEMLSPQTLASVTMEWILKGEDRAERPHPWLPHEQNLTWAAPVREVLADWEVRRPEKYAEFWKQIRMAENNSGGKQPWGPRLAAAGILPKPAVNSIAAAIHQFLHPGDLTGVIRAGKRGLWLEIPLLVSGLVSLGLWLTPLGWSAALAGLAGLSVFTFAHRALQVLAEERAAGRLLGRNSLPVLAARWRDLANRSFGRQLAVFLPYLALTLPLPGWPAMLAVAGLGAALQVRYDLRQFAQWQPSMNASFPRTPWWSRGLNRILAALAPRKYGAWLLRNDTSALANRLRDTRDGLGSRYAAWIAGSPVDSEALLQALEAQADSQAQAASLATLFRLSSRIPGWQGVVLGRWNGQAIAVPQAWVNGHTSPARRMERLLQRQGLPAELRQKWFPQPQPRRSRFDAAA